MAYWKSQRLGLWRKPYWGAFGRQPALMDAYIANSGDGQQIVSFHFVQK
jgi:hypothetical protein